MDRNDLGKSAQPDPSKRIPSDFRPKTHRERLRKDRLVKLFPDSSIDIKGREADGPHYVAMLNLLNRFEGTPHEREIWDVVFHWTRPSVDELPEVDLVAKAEGLSRQEYLAKITLDEIQHFIRKKGISISQMPMADAPSPSYPIERPSTAPHAPSLAVRTGNAESNSLAEAAFITELKELRGEFQSLKANQVPSAFVLISGGEITFLYWPENDGASANLESLKAAIHDLSSLWQRAGAILRRLEQADTRFQTFFRADSHHHGLYWAAGILGAGVFVPSQDSLPLIPSDFWLLQPQAAIQPVSENRTSFGELEIVDPVSSSIRFVDQLLGRLYAPPTTEQIERHRRQLELDLMQKTFCGFHLDPFQAVGGIFRQAQLIGIRVDYPRSLADLESNLGFKYRNGEGISLIERTKDVARVHKECGEALNIVKRALVADYDRQDSFVKRLVERNTETRVELNQVGVIENEVESTLSLNQVDQLSPTSSTVDNVQSAVTGFLGGSELMDALLIVANRRQAFMKMLERKRLELGSENCLEIQDPPPKQPHFLYRVSSEAVRKLAQDYR